MTSGLRTTNDERLATDFYGRNHSNPGHAANRGQAPGVGVGSTRGAALPLAVARLRHFVYRHVDAERRRGLADDADDYESADGGIGASGRGSPCLPRNPPGRRAGRHGGPATIPPTHARLDGVGLGNPRHHAAAAHGRGVPRDFRVRREGRGSRSRSRFRPAPTRPGAAQSIKAFLDGQRKRCGSSRSPSPTRSAPPLPRPRRPLPPRRAARPRRPIRRRRAR